MAKILMCTGKKNKVAAALKYFIGLDRRGTVKVLGKRLTTKRALIWNYDELKVLYETVKEGPELFPTAITKSLDIFTVKEQAMVVVTFESDQVEDSLLKPKILALSRPFISQNVVVKLEMEEFRHNDYRIEHKCKGQIRGPVKSVLAYKSLLEKEMLCNPKTVAYIF